MWLKKFRSMFVLGSLLCSGVVNYSGVANAQAIDLMRGDHHPFHPVDLSDYHNGRPFEAADLSEYGTGPKANEGFFFTYERCYWAFSGPDKAVIGDEASAGILSNTVFVADPGDGVNIPGVSLGTLDFFNFNTLTNNFINTEWVWGNRYELGYVKDNDGWLLSTAACT